MDTIWDDGVVATTSGHEASQARLPVVKRRHCVKGMGQGRGTHGEGAQAGRVVSGGMSERNGQIGVGFS